MALNPVIKFTTLFGLVAVELAVSLSRDAAAVLERSPRGRDIRDTDLQHRTAGALWIRDGIEPDCSPGTLVSMWANRRSVAPLVDSNPRTLV